MSKRILSCSITGAIHTPSMSPYLPFTPEQIAQNAIDAANAGASIVHIHARNPQDGSPSSDLAVYEDIISRIRDKNKNIVICITTGGGAGMTLEQRVAVVPRFEPALASMNAGSMNWGLFPIAKKPIAWQYPWEKPMLEMTEDFIFKNTFKDMTYAMETMYAHGTTPEFECYDVGHLYNLQYFKETGLIQGRPYLQFVMGINGGIGADPLQLIHMKQTADSIFGVGGYEWSAFGAGKMEYPICVQNLFLGGHVRVGMEDNLNVARGKPATCNADLVEKMVRLMHDLDYEVATPDEARQILSLKK